MRLELSQIHAESDDQGGADAQPSLQRDEEVSVFHACSAIEGGEMGLAPFQLLLLVLLAMSVPVIVIRKRGSWDGLRSLLPL